MKTKMLDDQARLQSTVEARIVSQQTGPLIWTEVQNRLRTELNEHEFDKWVATLRFVAEIDGRIVLVADTSFQRLRVETTYLSSIVSCWKLIDLKQRDVDVRCWDDLPDDVRDLANEKQVDLIAEGSRFNDQTFDNLVIGQSNQVAATVARRTALGEPLPSNTAFIFGHYGVGKTHILKATERLAKAEHPGWTVLYMSAEEFMVAYVEGVKKGDTSDLKARMRQADLLLIDDLQAIAGKKGTQGEFFANVRAIVARGGQVIMTADESPSQLSALNSRVREELSGGVAIEVKEPEGAMREQIVRMKVEGVRKSCPDFELSEEIIDMILTRVRGAGRQLAGAVYNIYTTTAMVGQAVTLADAELSITRQLGDRKPPTIDEIKRAVMQFYSVTKADLESQRRHRSIAYPRQIAMYLGRKLTQKSYPQIGRSFGKRDHTTVIYAVKKIEQSYPKDEVLRSDIAMVERALEEIQYGGK